jgi:hypothetical protein
MSDSARRPRFQALQYAFAAHLRDPARHPPPAGVEDRRLAIYRDLFFNNVDNYLAKAFPVLRRIYADDDWRALVRDYYARHVSHSPQFYRIAEEFLHYLEAERGERPEDPPFLLELAHYEWVELQLAILDIDLDTLAADRAGDPLADAPVLSPLAWPLTYRYPVHKLGPDHRPDAPPAEPTHLVVYRDRADEVRFLKLNPVTARLLALIRDAPGRAGRAHLETIATELRGPDPATVVESGCRILADLTARDILLGTRPADTTRALSATHP